ncbi:hypothetical protein OSB04_021053 [Centaurea solstitialis]|uniref:ENTH domain-containing protein n=1 Tax=Centaurea solstitialis TaxID=347529 RepID=A0AA38WDV9_9ASTR|nr:hypothetical protein OSB04_021053 [Centaurea solstitialis]
MGTFESFRRAYGALKDSTTVSLAKVISDFKNLDIAIVKATNHEEFPPKEHHVKRIIVGTSFAVPRADVGYCIHALSRRLMKTKNWIVAVKILIVFHRVLREGDPSFREELLNYSRRIHIFQILEFRDDSSQLACDCSSWVRRYAMFLEERLECYRVSGFDIENERLTTATGIGKAYSRMRLMNVDELLNQLPAMQQLLYRLIGCQPEGEACHNDLIQHALALVLKESLKIYCVINDGVIRLMESVEQLAELYNLRKHMRLAMNIQFPTLNQPPPSLLATMEDYVKGVSLKGSGSIKKVEHQDVVEEQSTQKTKETDTQEIEEVEKKEVLQNQDPESPRPKGEEPLIDIDDNDPPGPNETNPKAAEVEDNNGSRSTLGIVQPGTTSLCYNEIEEISSYQLAKSGGGDQIDNLPLYGLNENDITRKQPQPQPQPQHTCYNSGYECHELQQGPSMTSSGEVFTRQEQEMNQQYQPQYENQYQQWYRQQQQQNVFVPNNHQQPLNKGEPQNRVYAFGIETATELLVPEPGPI